MLEKGRAQMVTCAATPAPAPTSATSDHRCQPHPATDADPAKHRLADFRPRERKNADHTDRRFYLQNLGGQSRNRTTDTRIFKTTHTCHWHDFRRQQRFRSCPRCTPRLTPESPSSLSPSPGCRGEPMRYCPPEASTEPTRRNKEGDFRAILRRKTGIPVPGRQATPVQRERE